MWTTKGTTHQSNTIRGAYAKFDYASKQVYPLKPCEIFPTADIIVFIIVETDVTVSVPYNVTFNGIADLHTKCIGFLLNGNTADFTPLL